MINERTAFLFYVLVAAQAVLMAVLQGIPSGRLEKPYCLLSLAFALAGLLPPIAAMVYGSVCGALRDLLGSGVIGFYALTAAVVCVAVSYWLHNVWQNRFVTRSLLCAAAVFAIVGLYFFLFRAWQQGGGSLFPHYLWRMLWTYLGIFPLYGVNSILRRLCFERRA